MLVDKLWKEYTVDKHSNVARWMFGETALEFACQCIGASEREQFFKRNAVLKDLAKFSKMLEQV